MSKCPLCGGAVLYRGLYDMACAGQSCPNAAPESDHERYLREIREEVQKHAGEGEFLWY